MLCCEGLSLARATALFVYERQLVETPHCFRRQPSMRFGSWHV